MIQTRPLSVSPDQQLRNIGWNWMLGTDTLAYLTNEAVVVSPEEADAYYEAANQLFEMLVEAGQHVIDNNRFSELGIPANLVELIKLSWNDERNIQLYGRFDFAGGIAGQPIKLIEFNADTATCIPETAVVQYAHLRANGLDEKRQFNAVYETLVSQFREIRQQNGDLPPTLLLSAMRGFPEDDSNVAVLGEAAREAGFTVDFEYIDRVEFSDNEGIFKQNPENGQFDKFNFWFKLIPWEYIGYEESDLAHILTEAVRRRQVVVINPAYSLLFQSKYILKILWELYPYHPLLLQTDTKPLPDRPYVEKVLFGREGANVRIVDERGQVTAEAEGDYSDYPKIYQEYIELSTDAAGNRYQAGVFFAGEGCGLGFRRGGVILDNGAQFVGHIVE
ncbi:glutathionylspermidine synthase [Larkinella arboricola]|uniref:Glutathionylspermidine synthase n=1 Tax=Larkinella arboricola TaxID=643671 RepID=A0A327WP02_LARAB|nr:glutathionylspermidine synthase family protein [Larkinella arboricola]RAJ94088.1 glutathionylspermidine synthase [Larkinella arboricola]